jgi:hypothetical protein
MEAPVFNFPAPAWVLINNEDVGCRTRAADGFGRSQSEFPAADDPDFLHVSPFLSAIQPEGESLLLCLGHSLVKRDVIC